VRTCAMRVASRPMISGRHAATYTPDRPSLKTSSHTPLCPVWHRDLSYSCRIQEYDRDRSCSWHSLAGIPTICQWSRCCCLCINRLCTFLVGFSLQHGARHSKWRRPQTCSDCPRLAARVILDISQRRDAWHHLCFIARRARHRLGAAVCPAVISLFGANRHFNGRASAHGLVAHGGSGGLGQRQPEDGSQDKNACHHHWFKFRSWGVLLLQDYLTQGAPVFPGSSSGNRGGAHMCSFVPGAFQSTFTVHCSKNRKPNF